MKEIFQALVVFILAIPFIYMAFDIFRDIVKESGRIFKRYGKPLATTVVHVFSK